MSLASVGSALAGLVEKPPAWLLAGGYILATLLIAELLVGFRRLKFKGIPFRRSHLAIAAALAILMALHGTVGVAHAALAFGGQLSSAGGHVHVILPASTGNLPLWLDINGGVIVVLFVVQALSGLRKFKLTRPQFVGLHRSVAWLLAGFASLHVGLASLHLLLG
jgi:hypothetical protein